MLREGPGPEGHPLDEIALLCSAAHLLPATSAPCGGGRGALLPRLASAAVPAWRLPSHIAPGAPPGWRLVAVSSAGRLVLRLGGRLLVLPALEHLHRDARHGTRAAGRRARPTPRLDARQLRALALTLARRRLRRRGRVDDGRELRRCHPHLARDRRCRGGSGEAPSRRRWRSSFRECGRRSCRRSGRCGRSGSCRRSGRCRRSRRCRRSGRCGWVLLPRDQAVRGGLRVLQTRGHGVALPGTQAQTLLDVGRQAAVTGRSARRRVALRRQLPRPRLRRRPRSGRRVGCPPARLLRRRCLHRRRHLRRRHLRRHFPARALDRGGRPVHLTVGRLPRGRHASCTLADGRS